MVLPPSEREGRWHLCGRAGLFKSYSGRTGLSHTEFLSRCACFKHTNSYAMKKKYYETVNIKKLKEVVSNESKRKCLAQLA